MLKISRLGPGYWNYPHQKLSNRIINSNTASEIFMSIILPPLPHNLVLTREPSHKKIQTDRTLHFSFGRSVNNRMDEKNRALGRNEKELTQSELNQKKPQALEWQSHCQFYADCSDCQRFTLQPDSSINTSGAHASTETVDHNESCQRIKPAEQNSLRSNNYKTTVKI